MEVKKIECKEFTTLINKILLMRKEGENTVNVFKDGLYIGEVKPKELVPVNDLLNLVKQKIKQNDAYLQEIQYSN